MDDVKAGVYRHYKGPLYLVEALAHDANAEDLVARDQFTGCFDLSKEHGPGLQPLGERTVVVYTPLQLDGAHTGPRKAVRTYDDFFRPICGNADCDRYGTTGDGTAHERGACSLCTRPLVLRFTYVGPTWEGEK